jgi:hypothetical protein
MNERIEKNHFVSNLVRDWHSAKNLENQSFERYTSKINNELRDKKIEFCDQERKLDYKVLEQEEQELYDDTYDRNLRMACGIIRKENYTSNAMFMHKLSKEDLLLLKHILLNQLKEIDLLMNMQNKLSLRDQILARVEKEENDIMQGETSEQIGWMNDED